LSSTLDGIDKKLSQLLNSGQEPIYQLIHCDTYENSYSAYQDNYLPQTDCLKGIYLTKCQKGSVLFPELLIPLPSALDIESEHLLTPFPLIIEAPALNPVFKIKEMLVDILDDAGRADSNNLKVT